MLFVAASCNVPDVGARSDEDIAASGPSVEPPKAPTTSPVPAAPVPADPGKVPEVDPDMIIPQNDIPTAPPVEVEPGSDLVPDPDSAPGPSDPGSAPGPSDPGSAPNPNRPGSAPTPAPAPAPAPAPRPQPTNGFSPLDIQLQTAQGNGLTQAFAPGMLACERMLENVLIRDDSAGGTQHVVNLDVRELGGNAAGLAATPTPSSYDRARVRGLALSLDDDIRDQFSVCAVFVHEIMHTLSVNHTGGGLLSPVLASNRMYIDRPIAIELNKVGYRFVPTVQQRLDQGQNVPLSQLVDSHSGTTTSALQSQST